MHRGVTGEEGTKGTSYSYVLQARQSKTAGNQGEEQHVADSVVIIAGDSNMKISSAAIMESVEGDKRVKVGCFPGQTMQTVMAKATGQLAYSSKSSNRLLVSAGLNDVLKREKKKFGQVIAKGGNRPAVFGPNVLIPVCTVREMTKQSVHTERAVITANSEIEDRGRKLGFEVIDVNRVVGSIEHRQAFSGMGFTSAPG